jgi:hypothetical protein
MGNHSRYLTYNGPALVIPNQLAFLNKLCHKSGVLKNQKSVPPPPLLINTIFGLLFIILTQLYKGWVFAETRNTRPPVSLLLCDNFKNRMFLQNFFS